MQEKIVLYKKVADDVLAMLQQAYRVVQFDGVNAGNRAAFMAQLEDAVGLIGASVKIDATILDLAPRLKAISSISVGIDQFDPADLSKRGIALLNTPDVLTETTADTGFALILATARRVVEMADYVRQGRWTHSIGDDCFGSDVQGKTLGIVGMGRIGGAMARRASLGFGMPVLYSNRHPNPAAEKAYGARFCPLATLLQSADFVCITAPLTPETHGMIGATELAQMRSSAILINISRGSIIDETALISALENGRLRGAGLDVFEREPLSPDSRLLQMPNVVALPHIGSATHETRHGMAVCAAQNLLDALSGKATRNVVNAEVLTQMRQFGIQSSQPSL
ncbi:gluconate 2-dehydrogenase [Collimonas sp. OK242]|uniref:2-hydroxyacid dehydrogenase n=1 Tax=Collimonas sp. OK242 TaxID=1798195 RepID=UPI0008948FAA|nr:D-glycerate dehydrogenase [Collimonas sp. OK242]SDY78810.1 gluconate 2-dehydrogenase [Collimonas sp. OK242]